MLWIDCRTEQSIVNSYVRLAAWLKIGPAMEQKDLPPLEDYISNDYNLGRLKDHLQEHQCLIIYDNSNDWNTMDVIATHLYPASPSVQAIITTQRPESRLIVSEISVATFQVQQYEKDSTIDYMLRVVPPKQANQKEERASASELYTMYGGSPIFLFFIAKYTKQNNFTLTAYLKKIKTEQQKMKNSILDTSTVNIPLLKIIEDLCSDERSRFVMRVLAITYTMDINTLSSMDYLVPYTSETRIDDFKQQLTRLLDMSLIKMDEDWISIGHEIIQTYVKSTMTVEVIEQLTDRWFEESYYSPYSLQILSYYEDHCEDSKIETKRLEVAGIWDNPNAIARIVCSAFSLTNIQVMDVVIRIATVYRLPQRFPNIVADLEAALKQFKERYGDDHLTTPAENNSF